MYEPHCGPLNIQHSTGQKGSETGNNAKWKCRDMQFETIHCLGRVDFWPGVFSEGVSSNPVLADLSDRVGS